MKQKFSIVIPAYNEAEVIKNVLVDINDTLISQKYEKFEIVCVEDGSTDNTLEVLQSINFITLVKHPTNKGYGASLKDGIKEAKYNKIVIMDADGQHKPEDIKLLVESLDKEHDMVVGSRPIYCSGKKRFLGKVFMHKLASSLIGFKIPDLNSGFRAFYKDEVEKYFHLCSDQFSFSTSITMVYFEEEKNVKYIPIEVNPRTTGHSEVNIKAGLTALLKIIRIVMLFDPLRVLLPFVIVFFFLSLGSISFDLLYTQDIGDTTVLLSVTTVLTFIFALISDQISTIRKDIWRKNN